jgi:CCR4-NOT transcription complex subunit 7/8
MSSKKQTSKKSEKQPKLTDTSITAQKDNQIRDVYIDNFTQEIKTLSRLIEKYNHIAMDTEFPGIVYQSSINSREAYYRTIKTNVDKLKLIQVGISIKDEFGNAPEGAPHTWQFNLKFDLNNDQYSNESIALLTNSGINFELLENRGIPANVFGEYLIVSGLMLNDDLHWISFHGIYDFAYFLRCVTNLPLPETEHAFFESLRLYFPNYFDIRFLVRYNEEFRGSLSRLGQELNISRVGTKHQAGSDSLITSEIFFKLIKEFLHEDVTKTDKNVLFGIGPGLEENEALSAYNSFYNVQPNSAGNLGFKFNSNGSQSGAGGANNFGYDYNGFYNPNNLMNMQYNGYIRSGSAGYFPNMNVNVYPGPYSGYNGMNLGYQVSGGQGLAGAGNAGTAPNSGLVSAEEKKRFGAVNAQMQAAKLIED